MQSQAIKKKLNPINNNGGIKVKFTYNGTLYQCQPIPKGKWDNPQDRNNAEVICKRIEADLLLGTFDFTDRSLSKYVAINIHSIGSVPSLVQLWEQYKQDNTHRVAITTQNNHWKTLDNALNKLDKKQTELVSSHQLIVNLVKAGYSQGTIDRLLTDINSACNHAVRLGIINSNPYSNLKSKLNLRENKQRKQGYSPEEVTIILNAFKDNTYCNRLSQYKDSYFYPFVYFRYLTGCRPEDAIALEWLDVRENQIVFNKAYTQGILKCTKNDQIRLFPVNKQLRGLLNSVDRLADNSLVFPSPRGNYIDLHNFTNRYWKRIVNGLINDGKLDRYLKFYSLRHSFGTMMLRNGVDLNTLAALMETSIEMLSQHYLIADTDLDLPPI